MKAADLSPEQVCLVLARIVHPDKIWRLDPQNKLRVRSNSQLPEIDFVFELDPNTVEPLWEKDMDRIIGKKFIEVKSKRSTQYFGLDRQVLDWLRDIKTPLQKACALIDYHCPDGVPEEMLK